MSLRQEYSFAEGAMTMQITIDVPNQLGRRLQRFQHRLPEVLEQGLSVLASEEVDSDLDEGEIMALLTSQPTPEQVLAIRPSPALQQRMSDLLQHNKEGGLSRTQEAELERYLMLEHLVRLAKAYAFQQVHQRL